jgi:hypothetical protein
MLFNKRHRPYQLIICILFAWLQGPVSAASTDLTLSGDRITLHAEETPLMSILQELAGQGITIRVGPDINPPVTVSLDRQDLRQGLRSIIQPYSYALIWKSDQKKTSGSSTLEELQVFTPGNRDAMRLLKTDNRLKVMVDPATGNRYVRGEIVLQLPKMVDQAGLEQLLSQINGTVIAHSFKTGIYKIKVPDNTDIPALVTRINTTGPILSEPNFVYSAPPPYRLAAIPNQEYSVESSAGNISDVPVAILDSGLVPGTGVDPFVTTSLDPMHPESPISDSMGHGTQMAMIATGMITPAGVMKKNSEDYVSIIPVKIFDEQGLTSNFTLIQSLDFAMNNGARVVSLSWGTETDSDFLRRSMDQAAANGAVIVAAAGNQPTGLPVYPAAYDSVIGVGALTPDGKPWEDSNYGDFVSISAPGIAAFPIGNQGDAGIYAGTSISTAYVAAKAAKFLSDSPQATKADVYTFLGLPAAETP